MRRAFPALLLAACLAAACDARVAGEAPIGREAAAASWSPLGLELQELPPAARTALGVSHGVMVIRVRARAARSRLLPGDVILRVDESPVKDLEDFNRLVAGRADRAIGLFVRRADADLYIPLGSGPAQPDELFKARRAPTSTPLRT
jgi:membrane-associated protease RseP (regulator of RpoE activity)